MGLVKCQNCGTLLLDTDPVCHRCKTESFGYHEFKVAAHIDRQSLKFVGAVLFVFLIALAFWIQSKLKELRDENQSSRPTWQQAV
jgi:hypothetical protein